MCGIAGINLHPNSRINVRELAHNLLSAIESRGTHASGFAYVKGDDSGMYKSAVPGSQLPLTDLPRRAQSVILHTRFATQGSQRDNRNNHPVLSPSGNIALVHNGVISNDHQFRKSNWNPDGYEGLAAVDTAVIPALIEDFGPKEGIELLAGYAAVAWLDMASKEQDTLHIARVDYSPVAFTYLLDGSFVFASTEALLLKALWASNLGHGHIFHLPEETYITVRNGVILSMQDDISMQDDYWSLGAYGSATAGGHGSTKSSGYSGIGSSFGNIDFDDSSEDEDLSYDEDAAIRAGRFVTSANSKGEVTTTWENDYRSKDVTFDPDDVAMAYADESNGVWVRDADGDLVKMFGDPDTDEIIGFYLAMEDGGAEVYPDLDALEKDLDWLANMTMDRNVAFPGVEPKLKWTNFVTDMGQINSRGEWESWLEDMSLIDQHESPAMYNLDYIRDGLGMLISGMAV